MIGTARNRNASLYRESFYAPGQPQDGRSSAHTVVPLLMRMVQPRSVVDVGCGNGAWLSVFAPAVLTGFWALMVITSIQNGWRYRRTTFRLET